MLKPILLFFTGIFLLKNMNGQENNDTIPALLDQVIIRAYEQNRALKDVAAPVAIVGPRQLGRFGYSSLLPAVNTVPGVRMEERSPGSYRLNIRGSSLRSPFGVRNVKIYLNGIPFTDPGGSTYFNQLSFFDVSGIEIIKGPGSSLYGAGTGGVMLLKTMDDSIAGGLSANYSKGSFNTDNLNVSASAANINFSNKISWSHQTSNGYRQQSAMRRDLASWQTIIKAGE
ncbi:MAG: Plug domain-containing protein, partial [Chitinophagaceae bacterium]|nr:Plug domain-containing protein [Chitinophagaceae bacterium]